MVKVDIFVLFLVFEGKLSFSVISTVGITS